MNAYDMVLKLLGSEDEIPKDQILQWMQYGDLETRGALYVLTNVAWSRIQPEINMQEQCAFMMRYLLECLVTNPISTEFIHNGYEAAYELAEWIKHLYSWSGTEDVLQEVVEKLKVTFLNSAEEGRNRIVTGTLEHVFEREELVHYFESWREDPDLCEAYNLALEWGESHRE